jgi:hypothetical protein
MTEQPAPRPRKLSRSRRNEQTWRKVSLILVSCALAVTIAAVFFRFSKQALQGPSAVSESKPVPPAPLPESAPVPEVNSTVAPFTEAELEDSRAEITNVVSGYFRATTVAERLKLVRDPARVAPLMTAHHQQKPLDTYQLRSLGWLEPITEPGYRLAFVQALFEDATPSSLVVQEVSPGQFLIDWECLVRHGELSWADFIKNRPSRPTLMRLIASKPQEQPLTGTLAGQWLELRHPSEDGTLLAHFDSDDTKFAGLLAQLESAQWRDVPLTLKLTFPSEQNSGNQVHIASVEGKGWLILHSAPQG